jgi:hypothetical protein
MARFNGVDAFPLRTRFVGDRLNLLRVCPATAPFAALQSPKSVRAKDRKPENPPKILVCSVYSSEQPMA